MPELIECLGHGASGVFLYGDIDGSFAGYAGSVLVAEAESASLNYSSVLLQSFPRRAQQEPFLSAI